METKAESFNHADNAVVSATVWRGHETVASVE